MKTFLPIVIILTILASCNGLDKELPPPEIHISVGDTIELGVGDTLFLSPKITYNYNTTYKWLKNNAEISSDLDILHYSEKLGEDNYQFIVFSELGNDTCNICVQTINLVNFDDFILRADSCHTGKNLETPDGFVFKNMIFPNVNYDTLQWEGFAVSNIYNNLTSTSQNIITPSSAYAPTGKKGNFMIFNALESNPHDGTIIFNDGENHTIGSIMVCNTTYSYYFMKYGYADYDIPRFGGVTSDEPDYFIVRFEGFTNSGAPTETIEFYLADYRAANSKLDYIVANWTKIDLRRLEAINQLKISFESSIKSNDGEILTPPLVCFDDIKVLD